MNILFERFAKQVVDRHDEHLLDYGPDEQAEHVIAALTRANNIKQIGPVEGIDLDLAGFGTVPVVFATEDESYMLLSDIAGQLGWFQPKAHAWAEVQHSYAVQDQRRKDEERGDGRLGWDLLLDYIDLGLYLCVDDPEAKPDGGGRRWSDSGDWLISKDRLPLLLSVSPWGREFVDNTIDAFSHAMRKIHGDKLKDIPTVTAEGAPTGQSAYDTFATDLSEEEALRKARRGPGIDDEEGDR